MPDANILNGNKLVLDLLRYPGRERFLKLASTAGLDQLQAKKLFDALEEGKRERLREAAAKLRG